MREMMRLLKISILACCAAVLASCSNTKQVAYFQDSANLTRSDVAPISVLTAQPTDKLLIVVSSKDPMLAAIFNLPVVTTNLNNINGQNRFGAISSNSVAAYTVDSKGCIDFPILGKLYIENLKREEIASTIKNLIISGNYIKDPVVTVEFSSSFVTVLGDVKMPGKVVLDKDKATILEVLSSAGDLNITGLRKDVKVFREENGKQVCYHIDLTNSESVFLSPVYYVRQNDVVYVAPNNMKKRESTTSGNQLLTPSFWISVVSMLTSVSTTVFALFYKK